MAECTKCIHDRVCRMKFNLEKVDDFDWGELRNLKNVENFCKHFLGTDVVPKSEADNLIKVIDNTTQQFLALHDLYQNAKTELAREIFEEIERETKNHGITYTQRKIAELKKKYTEGR